MALALVESGSAVVNELVKADLELTVTASPAQVAPKVPATKADARTKATGASDRVTKFGDSKPAAKTKRGSNS